MSETLLRQWEMLRAIPRSPAKVTVATLLGKLAAAGFKTTKRTIPAGAQSNYRAVFPLQSDEQEHPLRLELGRECTSFRFAGLGRDDRAVVSDDRAVLANTHATHGVGDTRAAVQARSESS